MAVVEPIIVGQLARCACPGFGRARLGDLTLGEQVEMHDAPLLELPDPEVLPQLRSQRPEEPVEILLAAPDEPPISIPGGLPRRLLRPVRERDVDLEEQIHVGRDEREPLGAGR